jgi:O-antigen/teichoic acid export membrane protein
MFSKTTLNRFAVLADQAVVSGSALLAALLTARSIGVEGYGKFSAVVLIHYLLLAVLQAFVTGVYQVNCTRMQTARRQHYTTAVLLLAVLSIVLLLLILTAFRSLPLAFVQQFPRVEVMLVYCGCLLFADTVRRMLLALGKQGTALLLDCVGAAVQLFCLLFLRHSLSVSSALLIGGLSVLPSAVAGIVALNKKATARPMLSYALRMHYRRGRWLFYTALLQWCSSNFLLLTLSAGTGAAALGVLRLGQQFFGTFTLILQAAETYALPRASALAANRTQLIAGLRTMTGTLLLLYLPFAVLLCIFSEKLFVLMSGETVQSATSLIAALACVYLLVTVGYAVRTALKSLQLNKLYFLGACISAATTAIALLLPSSGGFEVVAGLFFAQFVPLSFWILSLHHKHHLSWKSFILFSARPILKG